MEVQCTEEGKGTESVVRLFTVAFLYPEVGIIRSLSKENPFDTSVTNDILIGNFVLFMKNSILIILDQQMMGLSSLQTSFTCKLNYSFATKLSILSPQASLTVSGVAGESRRKCPSSPFCSRAAATADFIA